MFRFIFKPNSLGSASLASDLLDLEIFVVNIILICVVATETLKI